MKKTLLFSSMMLFASVMGTAHADNALTKTQNTYAAGSVATEHRFVVPFEATGLSIPNSETSSFSVGFWFNRSAVANVVSTTVAGKTAIMGFGTEIHENFNGGFVVTADDEGTLELEGWGVGNIPNRTIEKKIELNTWYFMMVTVDNKARKLRMYIDQEKVLDKDMPSAMIYTPSDEDGDGVTENPVFRFGGIGFSGSMDNVQVYGRALDEDEALVAYYAPQKMTPEINALYEFEDAANIAKNSIGDDNFGAQYQLYSGGLFTAHGDIMGSQVGNSTAVRTENGYTYYWGVEEAEVSATEDLTESFEKPAVPTMSVTLPEIAEYEGATLVIKDQDGNVLAAGDEISYEFGDKFYVEVEAKPDYTVLGIERLGRELTANDYFYPVYDMREWRDINITAAKNYVAMTVENDLEFPLTVTYDDGSAVDFDKVEYGRTLKVVVGTSADQIFDGVDLDGASLTAGADGSYTFVRPATDFTLTILGHEKTQYQLLVARTEGGTVAVVDGEGNEVASGTSVYEGTQLTITATPEEGYNATITYNYTTDVASGYTATVAGDVVFSVVFRTGDNDTFDPDAPVVNNSCTPSATATTATNRSISKMIVSDSEGNTMDVAGNEEGSGTSKTYYQYRDRTTTEFVSKAGATVTVKLVGTTYWKTNYLYVDFNQDGEFSVDPSQTGVNGELVSHTGYNLDMKTDNSDTADPTVNSDGSTWVASFTYTATSQPNALPSFTLPADMKPGKYLVRYKMDWNNVDPCGRSESTLYGGQTYTEGTKFEGNGCIVDFTIVIPAEETEDDGLGGETPVYKLTLTQTGNGHVEAWSGENGTGIQYADGEGLYENAPIYFVFVADEGETVESATVINNGNTEDGDLNGGFTQHTVAGDVQGNGVFTVETSAIEGIEADDQNAPVVYYNLQGIRVSADQLTTGFYIRRQGNKTAKVFVKK